MSCPYLPRWIVLFKVRHKPYPIIPRGERQHTIYCWIFTGFRQRCSLGNVFRAMPTTLHDYTSALARLALCEVPNPGGIACL
ncbi:MAG: hypothetical protein R6U65_04105, partial [Perlabentimonas sp.]